MVQLTIEETKAMGNMVGAVSVEQERMEYPPTDVGPAWIGAPQLCNGYSGFGKGECMIIASLDTRVNFDHPSFAAVGGELMQAIC